LLIAAIVLLAAVAGAARIGPSRAQTADAPTAGQAVSIEIDGAAAARVTVWGLTRPFTDFNPDFAPKAGTLYVALHARVENISTKDLVLFGGNIKLLDDAGGLHAPANVPRTPASTKADPDLPSSLVPGEQVSGLVVYEVPATAQPTRVLYLPDNDHLFVLADLTQGAADATPEAASGGPVGIVGNRYLSPSFGFKVTWDANVWSVNGDNETDGYDAIALDTAASTVFIEGYQAFRGDPAACLADAVEELQGDLAVSGFGPVAGHDAPTADGAVPANAAIYAYVYAGQDGKQTDILTYIECRTLVPGESVLELTFLAPARFYDADEPLVQALFASLEMPDATAPATPAAD
jgi:hypothetical protein